MNESIFLFDDIASDEFINNILSFSEKSTFHEGRVGNRVNLNQKKRMDLFITDRTMLHYVDNYIFNNLYEHINKHFGEIKFREHWKIGKYNGMQESFYNCHRDNSGDTKYRKMSMITSLTEPSEYEGGYLIFDELKLEFKLKKGQCILFDSSLLHKVTPITSGIRNVLIGFMFDEEGKEIKKAVSKYNVFADYIKSYIPLLDDIKFNYKDESDNNIINENVNKVVLGDIDYSDKHKGHPWEDTDDYYFEDNNSDTLLVSFAGMGWKNSIPTFIFYNFLKSYKNVDKLFLRDINCRYYICGLKNSTSDFEETIKLYFDLLNRKKYKRVVGLGCSAGGYAAILYGQILSFDKVIAFSPQTVLNEKKEALIEDNYNAPKTCKWLRTLNLDNNAYQKALDLNNFKPFNTPINIHYSTNGNRGADKKHSLYLQGYNCNLFEHPGNDHMIALSLRDKGQLQQIIDDALYTFEDV